MTQPVSSLPPVGLTRPTTVVLTDDHSLVRHAIRTILEASPGFQIVGEAEDADRTIQLLEQLKPDLLLLDIGLPGKSGLETVYEIKQLGLPTRIVMLTMYDDEVKVRQAMAAGAMAYLLKSSSPREFIEALQRVMEGQKYLPRRFEHVLTELDRETSLAPGAEDNHRDPLAKLSKREREVFYLLAEGMPNRVIAKRLFISARTVETHRARVIKKLGFASTADLIRYAIRNNLLTL